MATQPFPDALYSTFVSIGGGVWSVKNSYFREKSYTYPGSFSFFYLGAQFLE